MLACRAGRMEVVKWLLKDLGLPFDATDDVSNCCCRNTQRSYCHSLLTARLVECALCLQEGRTAFMMACDRGNLGIVTYLATHFAVKVDDMSTVRALLQSLYFLFLFS